MAARAVGVCVDCGGRARPSYRPTQNTYRCSDCGADVLPVMCWCERAWALLRPRDIGSRAPTCRSPDCRPAVT
jgi:hypothetical protein